MPTTAAFGSSDALMLAGRRDVGDQLLAHQNRPARTHAGRVQRHAAVLHGRFFLVLLALSATRFRHPAARRLGSSLAIGIAGNAVYQLFFIRGVSLTTASNTSLILSISPIFVALLSAVLGIERIHWAAWMGILISFCGLYLVIAGQNGGLRFSAANTKGDLYLFRPTILWASLYRVLRSLFSRGCRRSSFRPITVLAGALVYLPFTAGDILAVPWARVSLRAWALLVLSSLVRVRHRISDLVLFGEESGKRQDGDLQQPDARFHRPVRGALLGESFRPAQLVGAAVILTGVYLTRSGYRFFVLSRPAGPSRAEQEVPPENPKYNSFPDGPAERGRASLRPP